MQTKILRYLLPPPFMQAGVVIASIVNDHNHFSAGAVATLQFPIEIPTGAGVKHSVGPGHDKFTIFEAHSTKKANALSCRCVQTNRIVKLWRNPHAPARAGLLEGGGEVLVRLLRAGVQSGPARPMTDERWAKICGRV